MNSGSQGATAWLEVNPRASAPQPNWNTATTTPYAAATESRFRTTALTAITSERNEASSSRKANVSTKPNTSGTELFIIAFQSCEAAVSPVTAYSAPGSAPT